MNFRSESIAALSSDEDKPGTALAKILLRQIEKQDRRCAFWVISAISKISHEHPRTSLACLNQILRQEMPAAFAEYCEYIRTT